MICLPPSLVDHVKQALISGKINPDQLEKMSSDERHALFGSIVGEGNAKFVNKEFETKMLLKNKQQGFLTWAKNLTGVKPAVKRDLISRIGRMDERILNPANERAFMKDLAQAKLGVGVKIDEAQKIATLSSKLKESSAAVQDSIAKKGFADTPKDLRLKAGVAKVTLQNYVDELKAGATKKTLVENANPTNWIHGVKSMMGMTKGIVASFTSHAPLKHGFFALFEDPAHWAKNYFTQFSDAAKGIAGKDVMSAVKAEGYSRENSINGIYDKWIPGELNKTNEEFHSSLPDKLPVFGHLYKGSKAMFDGFNLRMRLDMVDHYVNTVKKMGLDPLEPETAKAWGQLAIDQTGGKSKNPDALMSQFLFSQRLLHAEVNNLTLHMFDKTATKAVKVQSAKTLAKVAAGVASVMYINNKLHPGSAETDPRSSNFGKVRVGDTRFDISGGYSSIITLASRIAAAMDHKAAIKSSSTGAFSSLGSGFGQTSYQTLIGDFLQGRASPPGQIIADLANQQTFAGNKPTLKSEAGSLLEPIPVQTVGQLKNDPNSANRTAVMIAQQLGLMSSTYGQNSAQPSITKSTSKSMLAFKQKVGTKEFNALGQKYDQQYYAWVNKASNDPKFKAMSATEQQNQIKGEKSHLSKTILKSSGYKVIRGKKTSLLNY